MLARPDIILAVQLILYAFCNTIEYRKNIKLHICLFVFLPECRIICIKARTVIFLLHQNGNILKNICQSRVDFKEVFHIAFWYSVCTDLLYGS